MKTGTESWLQTSQMSVFYAVDVAVPAGEITTGRAKALVSDAIGLISVIVGGFALARAARSLGNGRAAAGMALLLGLLGVVLSVVHLGTATGGFGTGSGRAGAIVALVLSLIGMSLGGLALSRSRRSRSTG